MMLCTFCDGLSVRLLIDLAKVEFCARQFPLQAYYQHQPSYTDLVRSAENGCSLCSLIFHGCKELKIPDSISLWDGSTRDEAASRIESEGEVSDIKICILADHLYSDLDLDQVELFDVLMIQIGAPERIAGSEPSYSDDYFIPPLRLALSAPPGELKRVDKYRVGRSQLDPDLESEHNYSIAKSWIEDCCTHHAHCPNKQVSKLPTRVIDVGILNGPKIPRLILSVGLEASYAALSHCWGGDVSPLLKQDDLDSFRDAINVADLPANFRDAISITRQLGIQYLWIDSLCIIQDSKEDWEIESKMMGSIYRNSLVTISAATSHCSTDGIFKRPLNSRKNKEALSVLLPLDKGSIDNIQLSFQEDEEESLRDLFGRSPLMKRGWTLQEGILPPRIVYYGERQIYWKCPQGFQSADGVPSGNLMPEENAYSAIADLLHSHSLNLPVAETFDQTLILKDYYGLVSEYSSRELSFNSDKLSAFSGLASFIHPVIGGEYLAGIWSMDFRQGLIWYKEMRECRHTLSAQIPSWSWAVTNDPVVFELSDRKRYKSLLGAQLLERSVKLKGRNPFGQVSSGRLVISGLTMKLFRSSQFINFSDKGYNRIYFDEMEADGIYRSDAGFEFTNENGNYLLSISRPNMADYKGPEKELAEDDIDFSLISPHDYMVLMIEPILEDWDGTKGIYATCLVLMKMANTEVYSRVGFLRSDIFYEDKFETWTESWEHKTVTIV